MPLVARVAGYDTIQAFRAAALLRYREARRLAIAGDRLAGIYLGGYAAEMLLKAAYFRLEGRGPTDPITLTDLGNARKHALTVLGLTWPGNLHDLLRWRDLLVEERKRRGPAYTSAFARSFSARVKQVYLNWREHLRYHSNRPYQGEVTRTLQAVQWLLGQYRYLQETVMPRYVLSATSPSPKHEKLVKKLVQEFTASSPNLQPLILEEHVAPTRSRHVHVIWDAWKDVPDEQRAALIMEAYRQAEGEEATREITIAEGVTPQEALALGLLPFKVVPTRKKDDRIPLEDYQRALTEEARNTLLGGKARELRYPRLEDAEAASHRLAKALPGSSWAVVQEVAQES